MANAANPTPAERPKVVVFWASLGFGHLSASQAIESDMKTRYPDAEIVLKDIKEFMPNWRKKVSAWFYDFATKNTPKAYDMWFQRYMANAEKTRSMGDMNVVSSHFPKKVLKYLEEQKPTAIVSTFNHATEVLIHLRDQGELKGVPVAQVMTDYVDAIYFRKMGEQVDMSFVPHENIREKWLSEGFAADRVATSGMPVNPLAYETLSPDVRADFLKEQGLSPDLPTILLVSGSAGVGDFPLIVKSISESFSRKDVQLVVVTAKNEKHFKNVTEQVKTLPSNIHMKVLGMVPQKELFKYMKSANVIVTKSGGLSISEIAVMGRPLVLMNINGGQETYNSIFFEKQGMALQTPDQKAVGRLVANVLEDPKLQQSMIDHQVQAKKMISPDKIGSWLIEEIKTSHSGQPSGVIASSEVPALSVRKNRAHFMSDEKEVGFARLNMIHQEKKAIDAIFYMWDGSKVGGAAFSELWQAAQRGVKVRIILDGWAPERWIDAAVEPAVLKALTDVGVEIRIFNRVDLSNKLSILKLSTYRRTHDKLMYFADQEAVLLGDRNMQNINFRLQNSSKGLSYRSVETLVAGPSTSKVKSYFEEVWNKDLLSPVEIGNLSEFDIQYGIRKMRRFSEQLAGVRQLSPENPLLKTQEVESAEFFHDRVNAKGKIENGDREILEVIQGAKSELLITSPYILLTPKFLAAVENAIDRKVHVTVITASAQATDAAIASHAFIAQAKKLEKQGAKIFLHQGPDIMHAKMVVADRERVIVTSHNLDPLSEFINMESGWSIRSKKTAEGALAFNTRMIEESKSLSYAEMTWINRCTGLLYRSVGAQLLPLLLSN